MTKVDTDFKQSTNIKKDSATSPQDNQDYMASLEKPRKFANGNSRNSEVNGSHEFIEMNGYSDTEMPSKGKSKPKKDKNQKPVSNPDTLLIENIVKQGLTNGQNRTNSNNSLNLSKDNMYDSDNIMHSADNSYEINNSGPHREMAIDCPDNFVGSVKLPPVYPPPQSYNTSSLPHVKHNKNQNAMKYTDSLQNIHKSSSTAPPTNDQLDRIRRHQEELRKRKEEEAKHLKEEEFLRTSLRGSKKLQALEKNLPPACGIDNTGFAEEDFTDHAYPGLDDNFIRKNVCLEDLFSSLNHVKNRLNTAESKEDINFLRTLFHNAQFQHAVNIHNKIVDITSQRPPLYAVSAHAQDNVHDIFTLCSDTREPYVAELLTILNKPNVKGLLHAHDEIADRQSEAITEDVLREDTLDYPLHQYGEDSVKIIHLEKSNEPLGATVKNEGDSVIIARIVKGGAAEKSGLLHEGDEIVEVNGIDMRGKNVDDVSEILGNMSGTITFMVIPVTHEVLPPPAQKHQNATVHLRALFNYDPEDDVYIPCHDLGISFMKGDILHVINQEDPHWWQAYREGEREQHSLAGLIPSKTFQQHREAAMQVLTPDGKENSKKGRSCTACGKKDKKKKKKKKKNGLYAGASDESEESLTYEEVARYYPQPNRKRPIVLIGPANVGRQELRDRLISSDMDRFSIIVPHTSRPKKADETNGKEYHFISRAVFEQDIQMNKFIEYGEFEKNYYGTTLDAVRRVVNQGRICILNLEPESLKILRSSDLKPYVISVYPGNLEKLRQIHIKMGKSRTTDEELKQIIDEAREMEEVYGHYFDYVLCNTDMDHAYEELLAEINRIEMEPQWVPIEWVDNYM